MSVLQFVFAWVSLCSGMQPNWAALFAFYSKGAAPPRVKH